MGVTATGEGAMKDDAFNEVQCPFNYKAQLKKARNALNAKVGMYISGHPMIGYRELAKRFHLSPGTLAAIAKGYKLKRKPGPRRRRSDQLAAPDESGTVPVIRIESTETE